MATISLTNSNPETQLIQQRTRVELHWLDKSSNSIDTPVIIPLDGRDFPAHTWVGNAPAVATSAEIRIIKPKNQGDLLVEFISFGRADLIPVPLIFLSETPGELTVSKLRVAYDLPESSLPIPPPSRRTSTPNFQSRQALAPQTQQPPVVQPLADPIIPPVPSKASQGHPSRN